MNDRTYPTWQLKARQAQAAEQARLDELGVEGARVAQIFVNKHVLKTLEKGE
jgi:hypothetical protein